MDLFHKLRLRFLFLTFNRLKLACPGLVKCYKYNKFNEL